MVIFSLAPDQIIAQMWSNGACLSKWPDSHTIFRRRGGVGGSPSAVCGSSNFQSASVRRFWFQICNCIHNSIINAETRVTFDIKMLHGHFTKVLNYTTLSVSSVSLKQGRLNIPANRRCSSWRRQGIPGTCSRHRKARSASVEQRVDGTIKADRRRRRTVFYMCRIMHHPTSDHHFKAKIVCIIRKILWQMNIIIEIIIISE